MSTVFKARLMQRLVAARAGKSTKNALQKGFTLVELMVVVAIVGILSAVALPNFLSQAAKAQATEARSLISGALKEAMVASTDDTLDLWQSEQCPTQSKLFRFECSSNNGVATVDATGLDAANEELKGQVINGSIALNSTAGPQGQVEICASNLAKVGIKTCEGFSAGGGGGGN